MKANRTHAFYEHENSFGNVDESLVCGRPTWTVKGGYARMKRKTTGLVDCKDCLAILRKKEGYKCSTTKR